jgi:dethiobiotin synthetase
VTSTPAALFITGTDTGVGKTHVAVALLRAHVAAGRRAVGMKPVAAGIAAGEGQNADVAALAAAGNVDAPAEDRNPYAFVPAIAPHLAAALAGVAIDLGAIERAYRRLEARADAVVVEGAGGPLVPLDARHDMLDIAQRLRLHVLLVVGIRLGCLSHALMAEQAIRARGLALAGWVANVVDPGMPMQDENIDALARRIAAPCVAIARHRHPVQFPDPWLRGVEPC